MRKEKRIEITREGLRRYLLYDQKEGVFRYRYSRYRAKSGAIAGTKNKSGYLVIGINGQVYYAHRLVWLYEYGYWPKYIDHINGDKSDNRISNLRSVSMSENLKNAKQFSHNKSGISGVHFDKNANKWQAQVKINGKSQYLGNYDTIEEAALVRIKAQNENGFTARHGKAE